VNVDIPPNGILGDALAKSIFTNLRIAQTRRFEGRGRGPGVGNPRRGQVCAVATWAGQCAQTCISQSMKLTSPAGPALARARALRGKSDTAPVILAGKGLRPQKGQGYGPAHIRPPCRHLPPQPPSCVTDIQPRIKAGTPAKVPLLSTSNTGCQASSAEAELGSQRSRLCFTRICQLFDRHPSRLSLSVDRLEPAAFNAVVPVGVSCLSGQRGFQW
jgi:hypothetical protein